MKLIQLLGITSMLLVLLIVIIGYTKFGDEIFTDKNLKSVVKDNLGQNLLLSAVFC